MSKAPRAIRLDNPKPGEPAGEVPIRQGDLAILPESEPIDAMAPVVPVKPKRRFSWGSLFVAGLSGFLALAAGVWVENTIRALMSQNPLLGYAALVCAVVATLALLVMLARVLRDILRERKVEALRERAVAALVGGTPDEGRAIAGELVTLYKGRAQAAQGRAALQEALPQLFAARDMLTVAERSLLAPLDALATAQIAQAARRVSLVTAVSPRALVDVLFVLTTPVAHAAKDVVRKTPIVFSVADALATGLVSNVTRPGGLMTGVMLFSAELGPKRLEILREAMPGVSRVGFLASSIDPNAATFIRETTAAAQKLGIALVPLAVRGPEEFGGALDTMLGQNVQAVILQSLFSATSRQFIEPALARGLPCVGDQPVFAENGALLAFGSDRLRLFGRAAAQIDRILKGTNPGDIPVEGPTTFWLAVNQKTARTLGLPLPASLLIRADEVIE